MFFLLFLLLLLSLLFLSRGQLFKEFLGLHLCFVAQILNFFNEIKPRFIVKLFDQRRQCLSGFVAGKEVKVYVPYNIGEDFLVGAGLSGQMIEVVAGITLNHFCAGTVLEEDLHRFKVRIWAHDCKL